MDTPMLLLVGLGNPGARYENNRHNVGFLAADEIRRRWKFDAEKAKFLGLMSRGEIATAGGAEPAILLKPQTFMNDSGQAVGQAMRFFKIKPQDVVVFYDELDLAPGRFRMKTGGGAAGHNGIRSIIAHIDADFRRARIGIGHPGHKEKVLGYVLNDFSKADHAWLDPLLGACADALPMLAEGLDEKYQAEVMRLAPAEKADPRKLARGAD